MILFLGVACIQTISPASGRSREDIVQIPVSVRDRRGNLIHQKITVTVFRDDVRPKSPFLILNHGRASRAEKRAAVGRARYSDNAAYFVKLGFAVFVPTRIGYGVTGGPDVEDSGRCSDRDFTPVYEAGARQTLAVIEYARKQAYVDASNGVVAGQSFGGVTAIAVAAKNVTGVKAAINFAGGGGGDPIKHPEQPCSEPKMRALFAGYGSSAKLPTLWLYSENDKYWGSHFPRAWFDAFRASGGRGAFVQLRPYKEDGHGIFTGDPAAWRPAVEDFLRRHVEAATPLSSPMQLGAARRLAVKRQEVVSGVS